MKKVGYIAQPRNHEGETMMSKHCSLTVYTIMSWINIGKQWTKKHGALLDTRLPRGVLMTSLNVILGI